MVKNREQGNPWPMEYECEYLVHMRYKEMLRWNDGWIHPWVDVCRERPCNAGSGWDLNWVINICRQRGGTALASGQRGRQQMMDVPNRSRWPLKGNTHTHNLGPATFGQTHAYTSNTKNRRNQFKTTTREVGKMYLILWGLLSRGRDYIYIFINR